MKASVALEISEHYLKIAAAKSFVKQRQLDHCVVKDISSLGDREIAQLAATALRDLKLSPQPLIVSVPRNKVTVRILHLPSQDKKEIEQMLQLHIGRIIPSKKEDIVFSYVSLGLDELNYEKVLLAIVQRDILKRYLKILESAGLPIDRVSLSSYGVWEWLLYKEKQEINQQDLYLALDVDTDFTDFIIFNRQQVIFNHNIPMGLAAASGPEAANKLIGEVRQSLVIFHNEETNRNPVKIFLLGSQVGSGLENVMRQEIDIPLKRIAGADIKKMNIPDNVSFSALSAFAILDCPNSLSFTLPEIQIRKNLRDRTKELTILGSLAIYFFTAALILFWGILISQQAYFNKLTSYNKSIENDVGGLLAEYRNIQFIKNYLFTRRFPLVAVAELQEITPEGIMIDSLLIDDTGKVSLRGKGQYLSVVFKYITILENSKYFRDAASKSTRTRKMDNKEVTSFEIEFKFTTEELLIKNETAAVKKQG